MKITLSLAALAIVLAAVSCKKDLTTQSVSDDASRTAGLNSLAAYDSLPLVAVQQNPEVLLTNAAGYNVYNGGYGSAMAVAPFGSVRPGLPQEKLRLFYFMTDRGPNVARVGGGLYFPVASFSPKIGVFRLSGSKLTRLSEIEFKNNQGAPITGLPNPADQNPTGEVPYDANGNVLPYDPSGLDPEGLAVAKDGSFWVSDEYGPHIVHFTRTGRQIERISPFQNGTGNRELPKVLIKRRPNRGMEGLAITPDGKWLVGGMQSPLDNPGASSSLLTEARNSRANRLVMFNIATGATRQLVYRTEVMGNYISEVIAVNSHEFLVIERDGNYPLPGNPAAAFKRVYRIDISGATDVSDTANSVTGKLFSGKTLEVAAYENDPAFAAVVPVSKTLVVDITAQYPGYPHDKTEGIALVDENTLAVCNDDDFGVADDGAGNYMPKYLPYYQPQQVIDFGEMYFLPVAGCGSGKRLK